MPSSRLLTSCSINDHFSIWNGSRKASNVRTWPEYVSIGVGLLFSLSISLRPLWKHLKWGLQYAAGHKILPFPRTVGCCKMLQSVERVFFKFSFFFFVKQLYSILILIAIRQSGPISIEAFDQGRSNLVPGLLFLAASADAFVPGSAYITILSSFIQAGCFATLCSEGPSLQS